KYYIYSSGNRRNIHLSGCSLFLGKRQMIIYHRSKGFVNGWGEKVGSYSVIISPLKFSRKRPFSNKVKG
ncbi:MAG: hypothetical protein PHI00_04565, partial [Atribacterota bacterium]|nr:hypothetical protein [Atribacterota bacterium]MDI9608389.1 hypothetical protein [Atribacterota bacterium]